MLSAGQLSTTAMLGLPLNEDGLVEAMQLHYDERLALYRALAALTLAATSPDHPHHHAGAAALQRLNKPQPGLAVTVLHAFRHTAQRTLPAFMVRC